MISPLSSAGWTCVDGVGKPAHPWTQHTAIGQSQLGSKTHYCKFRMLHCESSCNPTRQHTHIPIAFPSSLVDPVNILWKKWVAVLAAHPQESITSAVRKCQHISWRYFTINPPCHKLCNCFILTPGQRFMSSSWSKPSRPCCKSQFTILLLHRRQAQAHPFIQGK